MSKAPILKHLADLPAYRISPGDTVKLSSLTGPSDGSPTSVFLEVWDPDGAQPDNSHPDSVEIFVFLAGRGQAVSDEHVVDVKAGDVLVLPKGSVHHIRNTSDSERLYAVTIMANDSGALDGGFENLVTAGTPEPLGDDCLAGLEPKPFS